MSDIVVLLVLLAFIIVGISRPYVAFAGYLWVDIIVPQKILYGFLSGQPISMVMAVLCVISFLINFSRLSKPSSFAIPLYYFLFLVWITITTYNFALFPYYAMAKWDWAFKSILMAFLMMFTIKERSHLDVMIWVLFLSINFYVLSAGLKTLGGGGGYGARLITGTVNSGWGESSTLAMVTLLNLPLCAHLMKHMSFFSDKFKRPIFWYGLSFLSIVGMFGSTARTGIVTLAGYIGYRNMSFWRMLLFVPIVILFGILSFQFWPAELQERLLTMQDVESESSAMGRVVVWLWTLDFVTDYPFGGGFDSYRANLGILGQYHESFESYIGMKAFHNIFIEVLGEHGYIGLLLFVALVIGAYRLNSRITKVEDVSSYHYSVARCFKSMIFMICLGGMFIGIAYKPILYQVISMSVAHFTFWKYQYERSEKTV